MSECLDCAALPAEPHPALRGAGKPGIDWRPATLRPIHPESGPRSPRCATHRRAWLKAGKQRASDQRSRKRSGLDDDTKAEVMVEQGGGCALDGRRPGRGRFNLDADHDHDKAEAHDHPEDVACEDCMRGYVCRSCNRDILGMLRGRLGSDAAVAVFMRRAADYLEDPPAQRVRRRVASEARLVELKRAAGI